MQLNEENNCKSSKIFDVFTNLFENIVKNQYINPKIIQDLNILINFIHYLSEEEIKMENYNNLIRIKANYNELSQNDWELIKEGHNPNEIAKIIRNDEVEKLQEISSQTNFDFNQIIEPSLYERCSFINKENVSLIDYAAFFSAVKCFKHLLVNGANIDNTGKYAVAGGNEEIIHLCEQNHSSFEGAYKTAIRFHQNDIFKYIYENKLQNCNLNELGMKCILYHNYETFSFLFKKRIKFNKDIIYLSARIGNLFLVEYFLQNNQIPRDIMTYSLTSGNIDLVNYFLDKKCLDINHKNIYFNILKFILTI